MFLARSFLVRDEIGARQFGRGAAGGAAGQRGGGDTGNQRGARGTQRGEDRHYTSPFDRPGEAAAGQRPAATAIAAGSALPGKGEDTVRIRVGSRPVRRTLFRCVPSSLPPAQLTHHSPSPD